MGRSKTVSSTLPSLGEACCPRIDGGFASGARRRRYLCTLLQRSPRPRADRDPPRTLVPAAERFSGRSRNPTCFILPKADEASGARLADVAQLGDEVQRGGYLVVGNCDELLPFSGKAMLGGAAMMSGENHERGVEDVPEIETAAVGALARNPSRIRPLQAGLSVGPGIR